MGGGVGVSLLRRRSVGPEPDPGFGANLAWDLENLIIGSLRNGSRSVIKWNVALDENHGPQNGGCGNCTGLVTVTQATGAVAYNYDYYALGHASKFVRPGAVRIASTTFGGGSIEARMAPRQVAALSVRTS